jgi:tetratricopeptide (TPR) repeat protein/ElaB/YqjD/DUF883 family membrane-anchored ribosome-binding protein
VNDTARIVIKLGCCIAGGAVLGGPLGAALGGLLGGYLGGVAGSLFVGAAGVVGDVSAERAASYLDQLQASRNARFNHDLARAIARALEQALRELPERLQSNLSRFWIDKLEEAQTNEAVLEDLFTDDPQALFQFGKQADNTLISALTSDEQVEEVLWKSVEQALMRWAWEHGEWTDGASMPDAMREGLKEHLIGKFRVHFGNVLKDDPRALVAFQYAAFGHSIALLQCLQEEFQGLREELQGFRQEFWRSTGWVMGDLDSLQSQSEAIQETLQSFREEFRVSTAPVLEDLDSFRSRLEEELKSIRSESGASAEEARQRIEQLRTETGRQLDQLQHQAEEIARMQEVLESIRSQSGLSIRVGRLLGYLMTHRLDRIDAQLDEVGDSLKALRETLEAINKRRPLYQEYAGIEAAKHIEKRLKIEGDPDQELPLFVGRDKESERIDRFLKQNRSGILVITAPAGFGKTALLANWVRTRQSHKRFIAYHFFSAGHPSTQSLTEAYQNLLRQVYIYYQLGGEKIPDDLDSLRRTLYGLLFGCKVGEREPLKPRENEPLVVVLDALDEAGSPFPPFEPPLPDGVYLVVSMRAGSEERRDYLDQWSPGTPPLHLEGLPLETIEEWLQKAGDGKLKPYAPKIQRRTKGFPLYIEFLIQDLQKAAPGGPSIEGILAGIPKDFDNYVRDQFDLILAYAQEKNRLEIPPLFYLMTVIKGPITADDLADEGLLGQAPDVIPPEIARWLHTREQDDHQWYSFVHPLLAEKFAALPKIRPNARNYLRRLLEFCKSWPDHRRPYPYALLYYPEHLLEEECWTELYALARNEAFLQTQAARLSSDPGAPLRTLQTALRAAMHQDDAGRMAEFTLGHARRRLHVTRESPLAAAREGRVEWAWELADLYEVEDCILWHLLLAWELHDAGKPDRAVATLERLRGKQRTRLEGMWGECAAQLLSAFEVDESVFRDLLPGLLDEDGLLRVCGLLAQRGHGANASAAAEQIRDESIRSQALVVVPPTLVQAGQAEVDLVKARTIAESDDRAEALVAVVPALIQAGQAKKARQALAEALAVLRGIADEEDRPRALAAEFAELRPQAWRVERYGAVAFLAAYRDERSRALAVVSLVLTEVGQAEKALDIARTIKDPGLRSKPLAAVTSALAQAGRTEEARQVLDQTLATLDAMDPGGRATALAAVASALIHAGYWKEVKAVGTAIQDLSCRRRAMVAVAPALAQAGQTQEAIALAMASKWPYYRSTVLEAIASALAQDGRVQAALDVAKTIQDPTVYRGTMLTITPALIRAGQVEQTEAMIETIKDQDERSRALAALTSALAQAGQTKEALKVARAIQDEDRRSRSLAALAPVLMQAGQPEEVMLLARAIKHSHSCSRVLAASASALAQSGQLEEARELLDETRAVISAIADPGDRSKALVTVARTLMRTGQTEQARETLAEALAALRTIVDPRNRARTLTMVAPAFARAGQAREVMALARTIEDQDEQSEALAEIASDLARLGFGDQAVETAATILRQRNSSLLKVAVVLAEVRDKENFKQLLPPCAFYLKAAYQMCGLLAQLYPEQSPEIAAVLTAEAAAAPA